MHGKDTNQGLRTEVWTYSNRQHGYHKTQCNICESEDHMKPKCSSLKNKGKLTESKGDETHQNKQVASEDGGLYMLIAR